MWGDVGRYGETRGGTPSLINKFLAVNEVVVVARRQRKSLLSVGERGVRLGDLGDVDVGEDVPVHSREV